MKLVGEVRWVEDLGRYCGSLTASKGDKVVEVFTCQAVRPNNAQVMVSSYAQGVMENFSRSLREVAWTKEWEVGD